MTSSPTPSTAIAIGRNCINNEWVDGESDQRMENRNPARPEELLCNFPLSSAADVAQAVFAAKVAYQTWRLVPAPKRGELLYTLADLIKTRKEAWSAQMSQENGKTLVEARGDVQEAVDMAYYVASEGRRLFGNTTPSELADKFCMTTRQPIGVCGLITPWNFPVAVPSWKLFPCLLSGNTVVWKPAEDTPIMGQLMMQAFIDAGFPPGVVNLVQGDGATTGKALVEHPEVSLISFTGSSATGATIAQQCARDHKRVALEMGGKNAAIILADANLELAIDGLAWGAFGTSGQRCTATSRIIVERPLHTRLVELLVAKAKTLTIGDPGQETTQIGPLINQRGFDKVLEYIAIGQKEGATLVLGGKPISGDGFYIEPTIFDNVKPDMRIAQEEIFGPVVSIMVVDSFEEAITVANGVRYGLSSAIYTKDINKAFRAVRDLEAGITYVNAPTIGAEVHLPFGGVKATGNGHREAAQTAFDIFTEWKTVYIDFSDKLQRAQID
jgi:alpha-ketoglutaric semialdehyde dehydrogenase